MKSEQEIVNLSDKYNSNLMKYMIILDITIVIISDQLIKFINIKMKKLKV